MEIQYDEDVVDRIKAAIHSAKQKDKPISRIILTHGEWGVFKNYLLSSNPSYGIGRGFCYRGSCKFMDVTIEVESRW